MYKQMGKQTTTVVSCGQRVKDSQLSKVDSVLLDLKPQHHFLVNGTANFSFRVLLQ